MKSSGLLVDIRTIMYVNVYLLIGISVALSVIAHRHPHVREMRCMAMAFATGAVSTGLRLSASHIPYLFSIVGANFLLLLTFALIHLCVASFAPVAAWERVLEGLLIASGTLGLGYFTYVQESLAARSFLLSLTCLGLALLSTRTLLRCRDEAVRTPCLATAGLYLAFALTTVARCVGVLFDDTPREFFTASISNLVGVLGFQIIIVGVPLGFFWMSSARLWAKQNQLALTDPLTGLPNRRALEEWGENAVKERQALRIPYSILVIDIDHFKRINDHYGHKGGDIALRSLAHALAGAVRSEDLVARLGGEEFVILLWNETLDAALATAERIRKIIEAMEIVIEDHILKTTVSSGVAVFEVEDTFETVLRRADRALYAAKVAGRNCVMLDSALTMAN
jgi:diguanylate cyclase (GGDEF)-like protein